VFEHVAERLARLLGDEHVCLHLRKYPGPPELGLFGYHAASAPRNDVFVSRCYALANTIATFFEARLEFSPPAARISFVPRFRGHQARHLADIDLMTFMTAMWKYVDPAFEPLEVRLAHGAGGQHGVYRKLFQCKVLFDEPCYEVRFDPRWGEEAPLSSDPKLYQALAPYIDREVESLARRRPMPLSLEVTAVIHRRLRGHAPILEEVADEMKIRPRTLQHRLARESVTFSSLLDDARRSVAVSEVVYGTPAEEVAVKLGYEETSSFYRAFRRWTDTTPAALRPSKQTSPDGKGSAHLRPPLPR
jgi:AraC-like DNA-binding protein